MRLVCPRLRSLLPSTVHNTLACVNITRIHAGGHALSISAKPRSATHFPTSTTSIGLQCLLVGACGHLVCFRAVSHCAWPSPHANVLHASQILASLGGCQLEPCSPKCKCKFAWVATRVFKCSCGNERRKQLALVPMGLLVV